MTYYTYTGYGRHKVTQKLLSDLESTAAYLDSISKDLKSAAAKLSQNNVDLPVPIALIPSYPANFGHVKLDHSDGILCVPISKAVSDAYWRTHCLIRGPMTLDEHALDEYAVCYSIEGIAAMVALIDKCVQSNRKFIELIRKKAKRIPKMYLTAAVDRKWSIYSTKEIYACDLCGSTFLNRNSREKHTDSVRCVLERPAYKAAMRGHAIQYHDPKLIKLVLDNKIPGAVLYTAPRAFLSEKVRETMWVWTKMSKNIDMNLYEFLEHAFSGQKIKNKNDVRVHGRKEAGG